MSVSGRRTEREDPAPLGDESARWLCDRARASLKKAAGGPPPGPVEYPDDPRLRVLVAAGTGLAPFTSMVFEAHALEPDADITRMYPYVRDALGSQDKPGDGE